MPAEKCDRMMNAPGAESLSGSILAPMEPGHPKELSRESIHRFRALVPDAVMGQSVASWIVDGAMGRVRIKRADVVANQIQVWRGEPLAVHVPASGAERWYVLPVSWQLSYARANAHTARQHASHAFDCMMATTDVLPDTCRVVAPETGLRAACESAMLEARSRDVRFIIRAISRTRDAVADALIAAFEEELGEP